MAYEPTEALLERLRVETRFTDEELRGFFQGVEGPRLHRKTWDGLLVEHGIEGPALQSRLWDLFDRDRNGSIETVEAIRTLSALVRGTVDEVSRCFFELYDRDGDDRLSAEEVIHTARLLWSEARGRDLTEEQERAIARFLERSDRDRDGLLDEDEFRAGIEDNLQRTEQSTPRLRIYALIGAAALFFLTAWLEMGTSFGLPAMGALAPQLKVKLGIDDAAIGQLAGYYYVAAIVGPLAGGYFIDRTGPASVLVVANLFVILGAVIQAVATNFGALVLGRIVLGLGGEVTAFATIEILAILFPSRFMLMCGLRNLVQSASGFLAFVILPRLAEARGATVALWFIVVMGAISLVTSGLAWFFVRRRSSQPQPEPSAGGLVRALALRMVPRVSGRGKGWRLPLSFFVAIFAIKAFYVPLFSFTAFSIEVFTGPRYGLSLEKAGFMSGFISLLAGLLGPFFGPLSDRLGHRSLACALFVLPSVVAFLLFAFFPGVSPWLGITFLALTYGFGDTCAFVAIRLIVGEGRVGLGYGLYSVLGNLMAFMVPVVGGTIIASYGQTVLLLYFAGIMAAAGGAWLLVRGLEGPRSPLELPADALRETSVDLMDAAALKPALEGDLGRSRSSTQRGST